MTDREPVDQRPATEDTSKPAVMGKPTLHREQRAAETWVSEANRNLSLAIRYYDTAANAYDRALLPDTARAYREQANFLREHL